MGAQRRFLGERGSRASFRKADCIRCGAGHLLGPTWRPLRLRASPRPAAENSTAGFPLSQKETEPGAADAADCPLPSKAEWPGGTPGEPRGAVESEAIRVPRKENLPEGQEAGPVASLLTGSGVVVVVVLD